MATLEFIQKRIDGKEKEIEKLEKKMERILKAESTNWEVNPYFYNENDKKWTQKYIDDAKASLEDYKNQLEVIKQKDASRNVPAILEFLNLWKNRVVDHYTRGLKVYFDEYNEVRRLGKEYWDIQYNYNDPTRKEKEQVYETARDIFYGKCHGYYERKYFTNRWGKQDYKDVKVKDGEYEWLRPYNNYEENEAYARLQKDVDEEAKRKYDFIIERTNRVVGQITDASGLYISDNFELNGIIIGTNGKARVETITAGGWNIQCEHFRTLIHPIREKK